MEASTQTLESHIHHWVIEEPRGGESSAGRCKSCRAYRDFKNWLPEPTFVGPGRWS